MNLARKIIESVRQSTDENEAAVNNVGGGEVAAFSPLLMRKKMLRRWKEAVDNKEK